MLEHVDWAFGGEGSVFSGRLLHWSIIRIIVLFRFLFGILQLGRRAGYDVGEPVS